ncbi:MAG: hypothetical protein KatS3mg129_1028 [Leptospiraceae bacterium]|nr:MAG: hypothetical protein KatS3mg129_1028 [Leptospiraceae bacterium]
MILLLLTGIKEELQPILDRHPFKFEKDIRVYHSTKYPTFYAATTGPGLQEKRKVKKILENLLPDVIINAGLVGVLDERNHIQVGDRVKIDTVIKYSNLIQFAGGPGRYTLVTVDKPIFDPVEKLDLKYETNAHVCDMEAAHLIELVGSYEIFKKESYIVFIKIAGDRPENAYLFEYEYLIRKWNQKTLLEKFLTAIRFPAGIKGLYTLLKLKKIALNSLAEHTLDVVNKIYLYNGVPNNVGSIFIPHEEVNIL